MPNDRLNEYDETRYAERLRQQQVAAAGEYVEPEPRPLPPPTQEEQAEIDRVRAMWDKQEEALIQGADAVSTPRTSDNSGQLALSVGADAVPTPPEPEVTEAPLPDFGTLGEVRRTGPEVYNPPPDHEPPTVEGNLADDMGLVEPTPADPNKPADNDGETFSLFGTDLFGDSVKSTGLAAMQQRFIMPPFSVLDARGGVWQDRKRAWLAMGWRSELGRGVDLTYDSAQVKDRDYYRRKEGTRGPATVGTLKMGWRAAAAAGGADLAHLRYDQNKRQTEADQAKADAQRRIDEGKANGRPADARAYQVDLMKGELAVPNDAKDAPGKEEARKYQEAMGRPPSAIPGGGSGKNSAWLHKTADGYAAGDEAQLQGAGTSIFDPVLAETHYRWFCPPGGRILDPFAGGSIRGAVAACLGYPYTGIDLSDRQLEANREQWQELGPDKLMAPVEAPDFTPALTPVEERDGIYLKRDDLYTIAGVRGGKVRTCWHLARGATGLVTAGSRASPQVNIVAHIARRLGIPCRVHTPQGALSAEVEAAKAAGAEVIQHPAGYNSVIVARARDDAAARGWREIPFGMECPEAIAATREQVRNLPAGRLVVPVGSGMTLAGILSGIEKYDNPSTRKVLGVVCGADPTKRLDQHAPTFWRRMVELVPAGVDYHTSVDAQIGGVRLDPVYEAKVLPHLLPGDVLWCVGIRQTLADTVPPPPRWIAGDSLDVEALAGGGGPYDYIFSCPPYADLEVYSDDPRDLSRMTYKEFRAAYAQIIARSVALLREDRFATFVVGECRGKDGYYYGFVRDTIAAFEAAGARYYNEGCLLTAVGSLPVRTGKQFQAGRKVGKAHQNVISFVKGDWKRATQACGQLSDLGV